jgi:hypothetical protein
MPAAAIARRHAQQHAVPHFRVPVAALLAGADFAVIFTKRFVGFASID